MGKDDGFILATWEQILNDRFDDIVNRGSRDRTVPGIPDVLKQIEEILGQGQSLFGAGHIIGHLK